jgi:hypothetical protein
VCVARRGKYPSKVRLHFTTGNILQYGARTRDSKDCSGTLAMSNDAITFGTTPQHTHIS